MTLNDDELRYILANLNDAKKTLTPERCRAGKKERRVLRIIERIKELLSMGKGEKGSLA